MRYASVSGFVCFLLTPSLVAASSALGSVGCPVSVTFPGGSVLAIGTNPSLPHYNALLPGAPVDLGDGSPEHVAFSPNNIIAYVTDENRATVVAIRTDNLTIVPTPFLAAMGHVEKIDIKSGTRAFVSLESDANNLKIVDIDPLSTNTYHHVIGQATLGCSPEGIGVTPDLTRVYVTNENDNNVSVFDTLTNTEILPRISLSPSAHPEGLAIHPFGTTAYVTNSGSGTVTVIGTDPQDVATYNHVITTIGVGAGPQGIAFTPCGDKAYVANSADGTVSVIDTSSYSVTTLNIGGTPYGVAAHPDNTRAYVAGDTRVTVIRTSSGTFTQYTFGQATQLLGIAISPNGNFAYIANQSGGP
jgi:YVTN family beta-propeller protein